jgi:hypothetical protein
MTVGASHITFSNLLFDPIPGIPRFDHLRDALELVVSVIKIKKDRIQLPAIYAGMFIEILIYRCG